MQYHFLHVGFNAIYFEGIEVDPEGKVDVVEYLSETIFSRLDEVTDHAEQW